MILLLAKYNVIISLIFLVSSCIINLVHRTLIYMYTYLESLKYYIHTSWGSNTYYCTGHQCMIQNLCTHNLSHGFIVSSCSHPHHFRAVEDVDICMYVKIVLYKTEGTLYKSTQCTYLLLC